MPRLSLPLLCFGIILVQLEERFITKARSKKYDCSVEKYSRGKCITNKWQIGGRRSGKLEEGTNATLQPNRLNFWKFGWSEFRDFVLTIPILCPTYPFQWKILAKRHPEVLFTSYMAFVLPTLYTRGSGNLTTWCPAPPSPSSLPPLKRKPSHFVKEWGESGAW